MSDTTECQCVECQAIAIRKAASQRAQGEISALRSQLAAALAKVEEAREIVEGSLAICEHFGVSTTGGRAEAWLAAPSIEGEGEGK